MLPAPPRDGTNCFEPSRFCFFCIVSAASISALLREYRLKTVSPINRFFAKIDPLARYCDRLTQQIR